MAAIERKLGVRPIEELLAERDDLVERVADLRARYGPFGTFDHIRKMELARLNGLLRAQAVQDKIKRTNDETDNMCHDHQDYRDLIATATIQRAEWVRVEAKIEAIEFHIRRADAVMRYATAEVRL